MELVTIITASMTDILTTLNPLHISSWKRTKLIGPTKRNKPFSNWRTLFSRSTNMNIPTDRPFYLQTDSLDYAMARHISKIDDHGRKRVIFFLSRTLNVSNLRYFTTEKELLAIVFCLQKARQMLLASCLTIITNHQAFIFLNNCWL